MARLIPRLEVGDALRRLNELETLVKAGKSLSDSVAFESDKAAANATGGVAITPSELADIRQSVLSDLEDFEASRENIDGNSENVLRLREATLGKSLDTHLPLILSDAGHNEVWSFLTLMVFPDIVYDRWGLTAPSVKMTQARRKIIEEADTAPEEVLPQDRWIGEGLGRDRNYLRTVWRRWRQLGTILIEGVRPLGEDELVSLTEKTALARNRDLLVECARMVLRYDTVPMDKVRDSHGQRINRSKFARLLTAAVVLQTGPRLLDVLSQSQITVLVSDSALTALPEAGPWLRPDSPQT